MRILPKEHHHSLYGRFLRVAVPTGRVCVPTRVAARVRRCSTPRSRRLCAAVMRRAPAPRGVSGFSKRFRRARSELCLRGLRAGARGNAGHAGLHALRAWRVLPRPALPPAVQLFCERGAVGGGAGARDCGPSRPVGHVPQAQRATLPCARRRRVGRRNPLPRAASLRGGRRRSSPAPPPRLRRCALAAAASAAHVGRPRGGACGGA